MIDKCVEFYGLVDSLVRNSEISSSELDKYFFDLRVTECESPTFYEFVYFTKQHEGEPSLVLKKIALCKTALKSNKSLYSSLKEKYMLPIEYIDPEDGLNLSELKSVTRCLGASSEFFYELCDKSKLSNVMKFELCSISSMLKSFSPQRKHLLLKFFRDSNYIELVYYNILKMIDEKDNAKRDSTLFGSLLSIISDTLHFIIGASGKDIRYSSINLTDYYSERIEELSAKKLQLRKMIPANIYVPREKPVVVEATKKSHTPIKKVSETWGISDKEKMDYILKKRILILKSRSLRLVPLSKSIRIEDIETVAKEVLRADFDCVVIVTKKIGHKSTFRVHSFANSPIITVSSINKDKLLVEIFNKFQGGYYE